MSCYENLVMKTQMNYSRNYSTYASGGTAVTGGTGHLRGRRRTHGKPDHGCRTSHIFPDCRK